MPLNAELLTDDPVRPPGAAPAAIYGQRPAFVLGASLVLALAFVTLLRWTGGTPATLETVVQQPIPADEVTNSPRVDLTAPDPGDSPP